MQAVAGEKRCVVGYRGFLNRTPVHENKKIIESVWILTREISTETNAGSRGGYGMYSWSEYKRNRGIALSAHGRIWAYDSSEGKIYSSEGSGPQHTQTAWRATSDMDGMDVINLSRDATIDDLIPMESLVVYTDSVSEQPRVDIFRQRMLLIAQTQMANRVT